MKSHKPDCLHHSVTHSEFYLYLSVFAAYPAIALACPAHPYSLFRRLPIPIYCFFIIPATPVPFEHHPRLNCPQESRAAVDTMIASSSLVQFHFHDDRCSKIFGHSHFPALQISETIFALRHLALRHFLPDNISQDCCPRASPCSAALWYHLPLINVSAYAIPSS